MAPSDTLIDEQGIELATHPVPVGAFGDRFDDCGLSLKPRAHWPPSLVNLRVSTGKPGLPRNLETMSLRSLGLFFTRWVVALLIGLFLWDLFAKVAWNYDDLWTSHAVVNKPSNVAAFIGTVGALLISFLYAAVASLIDSGKSSRNKLAKDKARANAVDNLHTPDH